MKKLILLGMALFFLACSNNSDKPMPISMDNLKEYSDKIAKLTQSIEAKPGDTLVDLGNGTYKKAMEKMGYSFDETYRYLLVFNQMNGVTPASQLFWNVHKVINDSPDEAVKKGLISQRTKDFVELSKSGGLLSEGQILGLTMVSECEGMGQDGYCNVKNLVYVFRKTPEAKARVASPMDDDKWLGMDDMSMLLYGLNAGCYGTLANNLPGGSPIIDSNGRKINLEQLRIDSPARFKVDGARIAQMDAFRKKLQEEQAYFKK